MESPPVDYYAICQPHKMIDMTLIKSRFPFNQEKVNSILESITVGGTIHNANLTVDVVKPVSFLEELSMVLDYFNILLESDYSSLSNEDRFLILLRFYLATISLIPSDIYKPCTPFLGETFACFVSTKQGRVSYIAEQVSLHPHITCFYVEDENHTFSVQCTLIPKGMFGGSSVRYTFDGSLTITHIPSQQTCTFTHPTLVSTNLDHGTPETQIAGSVSALCSFDSLSALILFYLQVQKSALFYIQPLTGGDHRVLRVHIKRDNTILYRIRGRWDLGYELRAAMEKTGKMLDFGGFCDIINR